MLGVLNPGHVDAHPSAHLSAHIGVLIIVGGRQYRAGSGRSFVNVARQLAESGTPSLRFDTRGMGDSSGAIRSFEEIEPDIGCAIDAMFSELPALQGVVLWGLCDAASAALLYWGATSDSRVKGLVLLNPWIRSEQTLAKTRMRHHYRDRVSDLQFWRRLVAGQVHWRALLAWWADWKISRSSGRSGLSFHAAMAQAWRRFDQPLLLVLGDNDETALEFHEAASALPEWAGTLAQRSVSIEWLAGAGHTFSSANQMRGVIDATQRLLVKLEADPALREPDAGGQSLPP
jgi:exosortase A-associated hydrolase 1